MILDARENFVDGEYSRGCKSKSMQYICSKQLTIHSWEGNKMKFVTNVRSFAVVLGLLAAFSATAFAQIPNPGFETWSLGVPAGWTTNNALGVDTTVVRTTDVHSGTYAAQGIVTSLVGVTIPPTLSVLFPWTTRSATFSGYYKYSPVGGDTLMIAAVLAGSSTAVAAGIMKTTVAKSAYTQFSITLQYLNSATPDSGGVYFAIIPATGSTLAHAGSTFKIDDIAFAGATGVESAVGQTPKSYTLHQNYPNPFNPTTLINYELPIASQVNLKVYDVLGREVATLVDGREDAGVHQVKFDASRLTSGIYFYQLQAGTFVASRKLVLLR